MKPSSPRSSDGAAPARLHLPLILAALLACARLLAVLRAGHATTDAPTTTRSRLELPERLQVFQLGRVVPSRRDCASHFLVNMKSCERLYALRGVGLNLGRYEGNVLRVRGLRLGNGVRRGGVPLVLAYDVDTMLR